LFYFLYLPYWSVIASRLKHSLLYLNNLIKDDKPIFKGKIPDKAVTGIDFYEGVKLAADTLNRIGYGMDVYVHDVTDSAKSIRKLIAKHTFDSTDLFIGALPSNELPELAAFAKKNNINFVSALSPYADGIRDNPYFILMQPELESHCDWIMKKVERKYSGKNKFLFYRTSVKAGEDVYNYFAADAGNLKKVLCNDIPSKRELKPLFDSNTVNVIVMGIMNTSFAEKMLTYLNTSFPNYKFEVYGMPSWKNMSSLKKTDAYPNITVFVSEPFYFDLSTPAGQAIAGMYKKEAGGKPGEMVFRGYETMYWYAYLLKKYGTIFNTKFDDNGIVPFTRFEVKPLVNKNGDFMYYENNHMDLFRYQGGSYMIVR
jgi:hypothetical protein